jgi:hypothetical protein
MSIFAFDDAGFRIERKLSSRMTFSRQGSALQYASLNIRERSRQNE